ncbi:transforming growth factor-beta receptor type 3-like protein [Canis lupus familiaris]|uniref:transforming growth factor-beta receptor type 3-like protein n=1 Tax=Canis lupus familiaris TaxID=9615 RepID=UPI0018F69990|nr:transforming growth factor-beta receptor type 3-like protein [Canis lupus familiaris]
MIKGQSSEEQMSRKEGGRPRKKEAPPSLASSAPHARHVGGSVSHTPTRPQPRSPLSRPGRAHLRAPRGAGPQPATPPPAAAASPGKAKEHLRASRVLAPSPCAGHEEPRGAARRRRGPGCAHTSPAADGDMSGARGLRGPAASPSPRRPAGRRCPGE